MLFNVSAKYRLFVVVLLASVFSGCASNPKNESTDEFVFEEENKDKFEPFNRKMFAFNMKLDRWLLKPVAKGYRWLAPEPVEIGVSNFFNNLGEVKNAVNDVLQWKWRRAGNDSGRFLLNSTVGLLGFFDVAKHAGLEKSDGEDFGQTLAAWGVPQGPYLVLPFFGPSTVRSGIGLPADWYLNPTKEVTPKTPRYALTGTNLVQSRAKLLDLEELASGDLYLFMRDTYLQRREFLNNDGAIEDDFGSDDFGDGDFDF